MHTISEISAAIIILFAIWFTWLQYAFRSMFGMPEDYKFEYRVRMFVIYAMCVMLVALLVKLG